ncbi:MAG: Crp/Fnr family transcriptional regulator [Sphingomonadales bacterium]|nr:Crp/Fnr family transcriptional regulator [Sphingomonadales bacterium]
MPTAFVPEGNNLLAVLRDEDIALIEPWLQALTLPRGHVLCDAGDPVRFCYLPRRAALAAFVIPVDSGHFVETAIVGREGALGGIVSQGRIPAYARSVVLQGGGFYRISAGDLETAKQASPTIRHLFARYADCMLAQVFQSVACNACHTIIQRAARWLEAALERGGGDEVLLTQEQFAGLLGVGRSYASRVLQQLKAEGIVTIRRGTLRVIDRNALAARACDCNLSIRHHFDTVLSGVYPAD